MWSHCRERERERESDLSEKCKNESDASLAKSIIKGADSQALKNINSGISFQTGKRKKGDGARKHYLKKKTHFS